MKLDPPKVILKQLIESKNDGHNSDLSKQLKLIGHLFTSLSDESSRISNRNLRIAYMVLGVAGVSLFLGIMSFFRSEPAPQYIFPNVVSSIPLNMNEMADMKSASPKNTNDTNGVDDSIEKIPDTPPKKEADEPEIETDTNPERDEPPKGQEPEETVPIE